MAKKQETVVEQPQVEVPVMETPKPRRQEPKKQIVGGWEVKDRVYRLLDNRTPLTYTIKARGLYFFDEEKGYEREIKYCKNQRTVFVDEMKGQHMMSHITFRNGMLIVPREKRILQEFLSNYHPKRGRLFEEIKPKKIASDQLESFHAEIDALVTAKDLDIDTLEAIMRTEIGSKVSEMSSKELKRDALIFAKQNPFLFMELANDDNVIVRNVGIRATEEGIIRLSKDNRTFYWASNDRKLMNVPFDEHPYSALAAWFKTDEGMEVYNSIEKRLN